MEVGQGGKVLIVDDNADNVELARQILEDDYEIIAADNGKTCIEMAVTESPDVILLDVQMPEMDGYEAMSKMQQMDQCKDIPVIFLSARFRDVDRVIKGLELGALDYITKPVDDDLLQAKVRVAMRIKRAEDLVQRQHRDLDLANRGLRSFAYSASHDLRAPLRHISGYVQALKEDYGDDFSEAATDILGRIESSSSQMKLLIEDLLSFSRASITELCKTKINISEIAAKELEKLQRDEPDRIVDVHIAKGLKDYGDANVIAIVMHNLLDNAWKYTRKKAKPRIEFGVKENTHPAVYYLKDNGAGFDMSVADDLFQPFSRLHTDYDFAGNGIGLATVHCIIEKHGGCLKAEAVVGKGATFFFSLGSQ